MGSSTRCTRRVTPRHPWLLEAGVDPHTVTAIMGHSSILTSRGYMHVVMELARKALTDVGVMLDYRVDDKQIEKKEA